MKKVELKPTWEALLKKIQKLKWGERKTGRLVNTVLYGDEGDADGVVNDNLDCCGMAEVTVMGASVACVKGHILESLQDQRKTLFLATISDKENTPEDQEVVEKLGFKEVQKFKSRRTAANIRVFLLNLDTPEALARFKSLKTEENFSGLTPAETRLFKEIIRDGSNGRYHGVCWHEKDLRCRRCLFLKALGCRYV